MDFDDTPDQARLRAEVRQFLVDNAGELAHSDGPQLEEPGTNRVDALRRTQAILFDGGVIGLTWPVAYGGGGGTNAQQAVVNEELHRARVAGPIGHIGLGMCGPTVLGHGSEDQKQRYIRRLLRADDLWCQLFSEPGSGSDLAALRTKAVRHDDGWHVQGQKVWTTLAQHCRYGILLARTNPEAPRHRGLTMFVIDMESPGVTVRPLRQMNGHTHFNEVFLNDVVIDDAERLGDVDDGWRVALTTLMNERMAVGGGGGELGIRSDALIAHAASPAPPAQRRPARPGRGGSRSGPGRVARCAVQRVPPPDEYREGQSTRARGQRRQAGGRARRARHREPRSAAARRGRRAGSFPRR